LLAEITEVENFIRPRILARDKIGAEFPIAFYLKDDEVFDPSLYQKRSTIAILYAHQHDFLDRSVGIRQEDMDNIQVSMCQAFQDRWLSIKDHSISPCRCAKFERQDCLACSDTERAESLYHVWEAEWLFVDVRWLSSDPVL
jgi:hypothetical protein